MSSGQDPPKPRGGRSLYADLLDPPSDSAASTISRAPVVFKQDTPAAPPPQADNAKKKLSSAALKFQPTKRPQAQKAKPKTAFFSKAPQINSTSSISTLPSSDPAPADVSHTDAPPAPPFKSSVADWTNEADDDDYYAAQREKHERGGRKKRKKKNANVEQDTPSAEQAWDATYDPTRPNSYGHYIHSDEKYREIRDWKDRLYAHRLRQMPDRRFSSDMSNDDEQAVGLHDPGIAPPPPAFVPPSAFDESSSSVGNTEDPYARRMQMSEQQSQQQPPQPPPPPPNLGPAEVQTIPPPPPPQDTSTISRAPVRYNLPQPNVSTEELEEVATQSMQESGDAPSEEPKSNRPGQKGFAARIMAKYGWEKGQGLGATGTGIVTPLQAQANKRKKLSDAEGGGFASPAIGKIVGGKRSAAVEAEERQKKAKYGASSEVVCLQGMLQGVDVADPEERAELIEEIGNECGDKYGRVERVFIHPGNRRVFVKFTSQLSALRALDALEGRIFNGNTISARFWETEKFESGEYDV